MLATTKFITEATAITHGGVFHADDVMTAVILSKVFGNITLLRTFKVPEDISDDIIVFDIGMGKYDHHQRGGNGARDNGVPYAACGLIWKAFGPQLLEGVENAELVWKLIDRDLIQGIDANDNGVMPKADYVAENTSFSRIISDFNPGWDSDVEPDEAFAEAVQLATMVFNQALKQAMSKAKAQTLVEEAITASENGLMVLERFVPWQEFVFNSQNPKAESVLFVVYPSNRGGFNWQCVPDRLNGFGQRKPIPSEWKGLREADLQLATGVATATFCHPTGFIGGAATKADAIAIAMKAIAA